MIGCPRCGLPLPAEARFCARCGTDLAVAPAAPPWWILVLFSLGAFLTFYSAVSMFASFYLDPTLSRDASKQAAGDLIVAYSSVLCLLQIAALIGFARSRRWARVVATLACAGWVLTCVGIPLSVVVLRDLWRIRRPSPRAGGSSGTSG